MRFCFRFSRSMLSLFLVPKKAAIAAGSEAGMDCGTALAKQARLNPHGEALRRRVFAPPRAPAPAAAGLFTEKSGSQCNFQAGGESHEQQFSGKCVRACDFLGRRAGKYESRYG